ncbi:MAG TPA: TonB-dependent receptor [Candidatus Binatia bacterium]|nr:TonB-dependent receptor [Candidatus Binatia bacterium]
MLKALGRFIGSFVIVGILFSMAFAQGGATGAISGTVQDASGAGVPNAEIRVTNQDTKTLERTLVSGPDGSFTAPLLPVGVYSLAVHGSGFAPRDFHDVEVRITETTRIIARLSVQAVQENIEVHAEVQQVDTTDATTGQAIDRNTITALPLATQNFQQLLTLSSGAQGELNAASQLGRGNVRMEVNGQREDNNNYQIEGISATDYNVAELTTTPLPNPAVIGEFKVQTSLYDATQGRNGGGDINAILKTGTNTFHGEAYEFFRNTVLDANDYFLNQAGEQRPVIQQNIFGGDLGGPIGKDGKLGFFFVNYSGTRQRSGDSPGTIISTLIPYIPAADRVAPYGDLLTAFNIASVDPVASALIGFRSNQFGAAGNGYLYPLPNVPAGTVTGQYVPFTVSEPGKYTDDQFTATWDREFRNSQDKLSARFFFQNFESDVPFGAGGLTASLGGSISTSDLNFPYQLPVNDRVFSLTETHVFNPTLVNEFRLGFVRINNSDINVPPITASQAGIDRPTNNLTDNIYKFTFVSSGFQFGPTPQANQYQAQNNYNFIDTLGWTRGKHNWRFGGEFVPVQLNKRFPQVFNGQLYFGNSSATDVGNFLQGTPEFSFGGGGVYNHNYRQKNSAIFAQDDWKVTQNFTLNLGLRTEFLGAWTDNACHIGNMESDLTKSGQYPFIYPKCVSKFNISGLSGNAAGSTFNNSVSTGIGPRVGFAYDLFGRHNTTIRGGYGIFYVREDVGAVDQLSFQSPFIPIVFFGQTPGFTMSNFFTGTPVTNANAVPAAGQLSAAWLPCLSQLTGFVGNDPNQAGLYNSCTGPGVNPTQNLFVLEVPRHFVVPNTQQWNFTIQRDLGRKWMLEVGYVGTKGTHLRETRDAIQSVNASPAHPFTVTDTNGNSYAITANTFANAIARTPTPGLNGYSGYQIFANDAFSIYHSLQSTLSRRWDHGYIQAAYTFSKNIDATSTGNTANNTAFNDESTINASRGISDFNRPQVFKLSYVYESPFFAHAKGLTHAALGGWSVSGVTSLQSSLPFSILDSNGGNAFLGAGTSPVSASLAAGATISEGQTHGSVSSRLNGWVNPAAFTTAPLLYPGDPSNPQPGTCAGDPNFCTTGFGSLGRNIYRGPFQQNWDFSIIKHFRLTERQDLRFATDFFNLWNHPNFGTPQITDYEQYLAWVNGGQLGPDPFGRIVNTTGTPRLIQFSLRWSF